MFDDALKQALKASSLRNSKRQSPRTEKIEEVEQVKPKKRKSTGKRTDPDFKQVGAYIRKDTYLKIQSLLLERPDQDFSDLVEELLTDYLNNQVSD